MTNSRRTRRNINKELMFNKIMPSYLTNTYTEYYNNVNQNAEQKRIEANTPDTFKIREKVLSVMDDRPLVRENTPDIYQQTPVSHSSPNTQSFPHTTRAFSIQRPANNMQPQMQSPVQPQPQMQSPVHTSPVQSAAPIDNDKARYINITEEILYAKLGNMIAMFKCCNCDKCRQTIMLHVLNNVKPEYVYKKPSEVKALIESNNYVDINQPIIRAILDTKSNPPHKR